MPTAGLLLPILGALPDALIIVVSGLGGTKEEAAEQVISPHHWTLTLSASVSLWPANLKDHQVYFPYRNVRHVEDVHSKPLVL